jgi:hypothetical protein
MRNLLLMLTIAAISVFANMQPSNACPAGTHPYGGSGSHHDGGGCE